MSVSVSVSVSVTNDSLGGGGSLKGLGESLRLEVQLLPVTVLNSAQPSPAQTQGSSVRELEVLSSVNPSQTQTQ